VIAVARGGSEAGSGHECGYKPGHGHSAGHGSRRTDQI
jgi:hypothetical protein